MDNLDINNFELMRYLYELKNRHTGRTTRLVDEYIQELFRNRGEFIEIVDHYRGIQAAEMVARRICARLKHEHGVTDDDLEVRRGFGGNISMKLEKKDRRSSIEDEILAIEAELLRRKSKE